MDWHDAQRAELRYHTEEVEGWPSVAQRRAEDARLRHWYAGMLGIRLHGEPDDLSVLDIGCGPQSLLLASPVWGQAVAVDPLTFTPEDEARYSEAGIVRAASCVGVTADEVWMYNCLQHVADWRETLRDAADAVKRPGVFRIFEWVDQPTSAVHLHTLRTDALRLVLANAGLTERWHVTGTAANVGTWEQAFYAAVWERAV